MVAKAEDVIDRLRSLDPEKRLRAVKDVKNQIIGNRRQKSLYVKLGAVPQILELLQSSEESQLLVQCAACAGSFAKSLEGIQALLESGGPAHLTSTLSRSLASANPEVVKAAVRSLNTLYQSEAAKDQFAAAPLQTLAKLLQATDGATAETAARLLAVTCQSNDQREQAIRLGCHKSLLHLLHGPKGTVHAAIAGLATLTACQFSLAEPAFVSQVVKDALHLLADGQSGTGTFQLDACSCLVHVCMQQPLVCTVLDLQHHVLPVLLRLLADQQLKPRVPHLLNLLLRLDAELLAAAFDADILPLMCLLLAEADNHTDACLVGVLGVLEQIFEHSRQAQLRFVEDHDWPLVPALLLHDEPRVCLAACGCLRKLFSRARPLYACKLETYLAGSVMRLLAHQQMDVRTAATQLAQALLLHNTTIKEALLHKGVVQALASACSSSDVPLLSATVQALGNAVLDSADSDEQLLEEAVPAELVAALCIDAHPEVRVPAYGMLQNLLQIFPWGSDKPHRWHHSSPVRLTELLVQQLLAELQAQAGPGCIVPLLHGLANAAVLGSEAVKSDLMNSKLIACLPALLTAADADVVVAALWLLISMIDRAPGLLPDGQQALKSRREAFQKMEINKPLTLCMDSPSADVRNRALTAICSLDVPESDSSE